MHVFRLAVLLLLAACARSEDVPDQALADTESTPAGETALPAAPVPEEPAVAPARWRSTERGEGTTLQVLSEDDTTLMTLSCANVPRELVINVPGFLRDPSDSRFSLAMGGAPVILIVDATLAEGAGVTARTPAHESLPAQLETAETVTARYGAQTLGPYPAPDERMVKALIAACGLAKPEERASSTPE